MSSPNDLPPGRFRGVLVWIDDEARRVRHAPVTRALLRGQELTMEFTCDGRPYHVSLRGGSESGYAGEWSRSVSTGRLKGEAAFPVPLRGSEGGAALTLEGRWQEDGG
jgi:hypothetical protein